MRSDNWIVEIVFVGWISIFTDIALIAAQSKTVQQN